MTNTWTVSNTISGVVLGTYEGETPADALDAMARDAGYYDYADACFARQALPGEIRVNAAS